MVFPRYHQLQAVRRLEAAARTEGPGHNYLVEHSAAAARANTIAGSRTGSPRCTTTQEQRVFDTVIVLPTAWFSTNSYKTRFISLSTNKASCKKWTKARGSWRKR